jgi:hypothetical protein
MNFYNMSQVFNEDSNQNKLLIFYITFLIALASLYCMSVKNDKNTKILFKMICENYTPTRYIETNANLKKQYLKNYIAFINGNNETLTSRFFKNLEFVVAENLIKICYFIAKTENEYLAVLARADLSKLVNSYLDIFDTLDNHEIIKSLHLRTVHNICHIHTDIYTLTNTTDEFFNKTFKMNLESRDIEEIKNKRYRIWNTKMRYNLRMLKYFTNYILNTKN